jgi:hypothetical protein
MTKTRKILFLSRKFRYFSLHSLCSAIQKLFPLFKFTFWLFRNISAKNLYVKNVARNFYGATFFGHIFNLNNLTFIKGRILRKENFNRSRFCFLDFTITSNLEKYF